MSTMADDNSSFIVELKSLNKKGLQNADDVDDIFFYEIKERKKEK
jgi:hypothetical protein